MWRGLELSVKKKAWLFRVVYKPKNYELRRLCNKIVLRNLKQ